MDARPGRVDPDDPGGWGAPVSSRRITVDGELFEIVTSADRPGNCHVAWLTGPNEGYGFGWTSSKHAPVTDAVIETMIRGFLAEIDPETGYLAEPDQPR